LGDSLNVDLFAEGDFVTVVGTSKGKGFQGVVKRHGFAGVGDATHGQHNRMSAPGSIGAAAKGAATLRKCSLSKDVFGIEPNDHAIYLDVKQHLANRRQGTHKAKERAEITGSTKKIKKQKGTGGARAGLSSLELVLVVDVSSDHAHVIISFKLNVKTKSLARKIGVSLTKQSRKISWSLKIQAMDV